MKHLQTESDVHTKMHRNLGISSTGELQDGLAGLMPKPEQESFQEVSGFAFPQTMDMDTDTDASRMQTSNQ